MTITVNNVQLTVDEDMPPVNPAVDADEVASFAPFAGADGTALAAIIDGLTKAAPTADFTTTQIAVEAGLLTVGANTTAVGFASTAGGAAFSETVGINSGLKTADGTSIYLFQADDNDNLVYGTIGNDNLNTNPVAFILVIDQQLTGANVTAAKLWVLQYAALQHVGQNDTEGDPLLTLADKVFIASTAFTESIFSDFSGVAAGAPVFAILEDDSGTSPIDFLITAFKDTAPLTLETLNISNQGSFPGSLASGSQNITPGTGLRFDTITGGVELADKNDALIAYGTHALVVRAGFTIVQNQGGRPTDLLVDVFDSAADTAQGHNYTTSLGAVDTSAGAPTVERVRVTVIDSAGQVVQLITDTTTSNSAVTFNADGSVTVKDTQLNWTIEVFSAGGFDRFTATNVDSQSNAYVDIGRLTFTASSTSADVDEVGSHIEFDDSGPTIALDGVAAPLEVDDSDLPTGTTPDAPVTATIDVSGNFDYAYGSDGPGTFTYAMKAQAGDSGLDDAESGQSIFLRVNGSGVVEGYTETDEDVVFTVAVAADGEVTLTLLRAIKHDADGAGDAAKSLAGAAIQVTGTVTDQEGVTNGDSVSIDLPIGDKLNFLDDDPTVAATDADADQLSADDDDLGESDSTSFAGLFDPDFGADGPDPTADAVYSLVIGDDNSGIYDVDTDTEVLLKVVGNQVIGYVQDGGEATVFTITVDVDTGEVTLVQSRAIKHADDAPSTDDSPDPVHFADVEDLIGLKVVVKDKDGDTATATADITGTFVFTDGQPSISAVDATANTLNATDNSLGAGGADTISGAALFTPASGPDGYDAADDVVYTLSTPGGASGIFDVATGLEAQLQVDGTSIVGVVEDGGPQVVFRVAVNADTGVVTLTQLRAIQHTPDLGSPSDASLDPEHLTAANLIQLTATVKDRDGDTDSAVSNIGGALEFTDGQPTIDATDATPASLSVDDDDLDTTASDTISGSALFTPHYGPDGAGPGDVISYSMDAPPAASGLFDVATNLEVQLKTVAGVVTGYVDDGGTERTVFTVGVDADTGVVTLTQLRAVRHNPDEGTLTDTSNDPTALTGTNKIKLTATITDKDGDTAQGVADLTLAFQFNDGQPTITVEPSPGGDAGTPLVVNNVAAASATGAFGYDVGPDRSGAPYNLTTVSDFVDADTNTAGVQLALTASVTGPPATDATGEVATLTFEDADSAVFNFSFNYDKDPITAGVQTGTATGTLTFDKDDDTYTVAIINPVEGFSFNVLHTTELLAKQPVGNTGHPPIVVERLAMDDPNTSGFDEDFYVQFTADTTPLGFSTTGDVAGSSDKAFDGANHDLAGGVETWVSATQTTNGVAGDTIGKQELLTLRFFSSDILADVASGTEKDDPTATASGITLKFDGIGANEDLIMILDLIDPSKALNDPTREITRAVVIDNADIYKLSNGGVPAPYNTEFSLDNNDGLVIIESNDYNAAGEHYQIQGVQIMQGPNGLTGSGINLNRAVGDLGGSSTTIGLQPFAGNTNDVLKIVDIGFLQTASGTQGAHLDFALQIRDADGDLTTTRHLFVDFLSA
jgi:hypothetical protein